MGNDAREITISIKANNLTKTEFDRAKQELLGLGTASDAASQRGQAMGTSIRRGLADIAGGASLAGVNMRGMLMAGGIAGMATAGAAALVSWGSAALEAAGKLSDLSAKTGLSVTTLQRMQFVAQQTGGSIDDFSKAAFQLGQRVAGGEGSTVGALNKLGLSWETLKAMRPDAQFETVVAALERMESPQDRNRVAIELFGKSAEAILPAVASGYTDIARQATVSSDAQVAAMDRAGDALSKFSTNFTQGLVSFGGNLVMALQGVRTLGSGLVDLSAAEQNHIAFLKKSGMDVSAYLAQISHARAAAATATEQGVTREVVVTEAYGDQLAEVKVKVGLLTDAQRAEIAAARELGVSTTDLSNRFGVSEAVLRGLEQQTKQQATADREAAAESKRLAAEREKEAAMMRRLADSYTGLKASIQAVGPEIQHYSLELNALILAQARALNLSREFTLEGPLQARSLQQTAVETARLRAEMDQWAQSNGAVLAPSIKAVGTAATSVGAEVRSAFAGLIPIGQQVATAINGTFAQMALGAKGFKDGMSDIWDSIKAGAMRAFTDILGDFTNRLMKGMLNALRGNQGAFGQAFSGFLGTGGSATTAAGFGGSASSASAVAGGLGLGGGSGAAAAGGTAASGGGAAAGGGAGAGVSAAVIGVAATAAVGYAMGHLGQQIFGGAGWQAGTFGAASGAATGAMIGSVLPGIGTAVGAIVGGLVGMASGFIGVSKDVKQSRAQVEAFQVAVRGTLTDQQRLEAGGEAWKETVIAVRDAYLATGRSAEEAEAMVLQMWRTDKPKEAEAAVRAIAAVMDEAARKAAGITDAVDTMTASIEGSTGAADDLAVAMNVVKVSERALSDLEAMGGSTEEITKAQVQLKEAMSQLAIAEQAIADAKDLEQATRDVEDAAIDGGTAFDRIARTIQAIPRDIRVEVTGEYTPPEITGATEGYAVGTMGRHGSWFTRFPDSGMTARLHGEEAVITRDQAPQFVADYLGREGGSGGSGGAAVASPVYVLVNVDAQGKSTQRAISEAEYQRRRIQDMLRTGQLAVPSRVVGSLA